MTAKKRANWWIVSTHVLTAGFAMPLLALILWAVLQVAFNLPETAAAVLLLVFTVGGIIGGTYYSVRYLKKKVITENWERCTKPAVVTFVLLHAPLQCVNFISTPPFWEILVSFVLWGSLVAAFAKITAVEFRKLQATSPLI